VRKNPFFILTNRRDEVSIFRSLRDRLRSKIAQTPVVTASFEEPKTPDLVLQTDRISVDESASRIGELMKSRGYML
jgi:adenylylsulfate kinase-like enzyme